MRSTQPASNGSEVVDTVVVEVVVAMPLCFGMLLEIVGSLFTTDGEEFFICVLLLLIRFSFNEVVRSEKSDE